MQSIIIGAGEIGTALHKIIGGEITDVSVGPGGQYDIINICFPYSEGFIEEVKRYQALYNAKHTVIHSTIPVGTSAKLGAIHSPCNGIHPHLEQSLRTFIKFLGGSNDEVNDYFRRAGFKIYTFDKPETTELMKLMCTTFYGVCLEYVKDVKKQCDKYGTPFEAWSIWTENYNSGYTKLGHPQYHRPNLIPPQGKIGGHCVGANAKLIQTKFTDILNGN